MCSLEEVITRIDRYIRPFMQKTPIGGLTLALTDRHQLLHTAHYGYADLYRRNRASMALPERVRFDAVIDGQAWCVNLAGNDSYVRVRTP